MTIYEMDADDTEAVISVFGSKVLKGKTFTRKTYYSKANSKFWLVTDEAAARKHLADNPALPDELKTALAREMLAGSIEAAA